jgi:eukaryotic-like serine/threonine-protein kinase
MKFPAGLQLGSYEILGLLGKGGMGEVYLARDAKLLREVAIKVLPEAFSDSPERLSRFEREARILASLNHPNIAAVYGLEQQNSHLFLILEFVPGSTLAELIKNHPLPTQEAFPLMRQIAEGLEAAHEKNVIHRDLKPANIKITPQGKVKILDFGLAKAFSPNGSSDPELSITPTIDQTQSGIILGTAPYMSPEQLRGKSIDRRSDIWSFGCVFFEALTGHPPFHGETFSDTAVQILGTEPDWSLLPPRLPADVHRLIRRCLQKDLNRRIQNIGDARIEIEEAPYSTESTSKFDSVSTKERATRKQRWFGMAAAVILLAALAGFLLFKLTQISSKKIQSVQFSRLTDFPGLEESPAISPDGKSVAFTSDLSGKRQLWIRLLAGGAPLQITNDDADHLYPRWSPDSSSVLYYSPSESAANGTIWEVSALGGSPRRITTSIGGVDVSHDGTRIAFFRFYNGEVELAVSSRNGTNPKTVVRLNPAFNYFYPRWSPDDQWIGYQQGIIFDFDVFIVPEKGNAPPKALVTDGRLLNGFSWLPDGKGIIYSSSQGSTILYLPPFNLWTVSLNKKNPRQLTFGDTSYFHPDMNSKGNLVCSRMIMHFDIWKYPVSGTPRENVQAGQRITHQTAQVQTPSIGPNDHEIVYLSDSGGHANLWSQNLESGKSQQITYEQDPAVAMGVPVWSPDGKNIAFVLRKPGGWSVDLWLINPDGSNLRKVEAAGGWATWSSDGRWLYYAVSKQGIWKMKKVQANGGQPTVIRPENAQAPALSPDGKTLYFVLYLGNINGTPDLEIRAASPESAPSNLLARISGNRVPSWQLIHPVISPDGKSLAMPLSDGGITNIWTLSTGEGEWRQITDFGELRTFIARRVSWSQDGKSIYAAVAEGDADIILLNHLVQ